MISVAIAAFVALLIVSQLADLTPYIGADGVSLLNRIVQEGADVLTALVNWLTRVLAVR